MLALLGVIIGRELTVISLNLKFTLGGKLAEVGLEIMTVMASLDPTKRAKVWRINFAVEAPGWE